MHFEHQFFPLTKWVLLIQFNEKFIVAWPPEAEASGYEMQRDWSRLISRIYSGYIS